MRLLVPTIAFCAVLLASCGGDDGGGGASLERGSDDPGTGTLLLDGERFDGLAVTCDGIVALEGDGTGVEIDFGSADTDSSLTVSTSDGETVEATGGASDELSRLESDDAGGIAEASVDGTDIEATWTCP